MAKQNVVTVRNLDASAGVSEATKRRAMAGRADAPATGPIPSVGPPHLEMQLGEYLHRQHENGGRYTLLRGFALSVASLPNGRTAMLKREQWDALFEKYGNAEGSKNAITEADLVPGKKVTTPRKRKTKAEPEVEAELEEEVTTEEIEQPS